LYYCSNSEEEYQLNVVEKIKKIKLWSQRHLTMEGKTLFVMIIAKRAGRARLAELAGLYQASGWDLLGSQ
jgi:hypothetical protein